MRFIWSIVACALTVGLMPASAVASSAPASTFLQAGIAAYRAGAPGHALGAFAQAARVAPTSALPALWAGVAAIAAGHQDAARAWLRAALARPHSQAEERIARAWLARLAIPAIALPSAKSTPLEIAALARTSNPRLTDAQARWVGLAVAEAARREGIDLWLLAAVIYVESRFNHQSVSGAGAMGLGQLMPGTATAAGVDPRDPWGNILGAGKVLRWNYLEFGNWPFALAAYNAGSGAVRQYRGIPPFAETRWFVVATIQVWSELHRTAQGVSSLIDFVSGLTSMSVSRGS